MIVSIFRISAAPSLGYMSAKGRVGNVLVERTNYELACDQIDEQKTYRV